MLAASCLGWGLWFCALTAPGDSWDVAVYGATPSGIAAAIAAADDGARVLLIEPTPRIGGLVTSGLSHTDFRTFEGLNGAYLDFARRVEAHYRAKYGADSPQVLASFRGTFAEPKVNLLVFEQLLAERQTLTLWTKRQLKRVLVEPVVDSKLRRIKSFTLVDQDGKTYDVSARIVIDASYEGDLLAAADVPWRVGREGRAEYGETLAPEQADDQLQAYNFRWIMTREPANRVAPVAPPGYRREDFVDVLPVLTSGQIARVFDYPSRCIFKAHEPVLPNGKYDINDVSRGLVRLSLPGKNLEWPTGDEATRARVFAEHVRDQVGLLYFLQNDAAVPERFRNEAREWGWCRDEFTDSNHLPPQLYVREARRMVGQHVFVERDADHAPGDARAVWHADAIAIGDYGNNCHGTHHEGPRFGGTHTGEFYRTVMPYQIPYGVLVPREIDNLLVAGAVSSSHVGFCALRLEPIWMSLGQAAGHAAGQIYAADKGVQQVDVQHLQRRLHAVGGATIYTSDVLPGHADFAAVQWWGTLGGLHGLHPQPAKPGQRGKNIHGQYFEAFPFHAVDLDKPLDEKLALRWHQLAGQAQIKVVLPSADGRATRGDFIRAAWQAAVKPAPAATRDRAAVRWTGQGAVRVLVELPRRELNSREQDEMPAEVKLDFPALLGKLGVRQLPDLTTLQVIEYDPATGEPREYGDYRYQRSPADRPFRWLDESVPYEFPEMIGNVIRSEGKIVYRPRTRGGYFLDVEGDWQRGRLTWSHTQRSGQPGHYALYFDLLKPGVEPTARPPQGWIGDGLHRCDVNSNRTIGADHCRIDVTDWDGDGRVDLLLGEAAGHVTWLKNIGSRESPRFAFQRLVSDVDKMPLDAGYYAAVKVIDWDRDGDDDLLIGTDGNRILHYENTGDRTHRQLTYRGWLTIGDAPLELPIRPLTRGSEQVFTHDYHPTLEVVDWDGDGDHDLLAGGYVTGMIFWYENVAQSPGEPPTLRYHGPLAADGKTLNVGYWCAAPSIDDFDADGDLDLISGNFPMYERGDAAAAMPKLRYYENTGSRREPSLTERPFPFRGKLPDFSLATPRHVDFDGDGDLDLFVSERGNIWQLRNIGSPQRPEWSNEPGQLKLEWGSAPIDVDQFADQNGDGRPDVIAAYTMRAATAEGNPWNWQPAVGILPRGVHIDHPSNIGDDWFWPWQDDFDRDGNVDILFGTWHGHVWFHRQLGKPGEKKFDVTGVQLKLADGSPLKVGPQAQDANANFVALQGARTVFAPADFDRDGLRDLVVGDTFGVVRYFRNVGSAAEPKLAEPIELGQQKIRLLVSACDWNRDGWPDVIAGAVNGVVRVYLNRGEASGERFEAGFDPRLPPILQPRVMVVDLNRDGDDDLFLPSVQGSCFVERSFLEHGYAPATVVTAELRP